MDVVWSEESIHSYFRIIDYLTSNWSSKSAHDFDAHLNQLVERIQNFEEICPKSKIFNYYKCLIDKHNSLVYHNLNQTIFIVTIVDNRSHHPY